MEILNLFQETIYWPDIVREQRFAQQSERMQNLKLELALTSSIYACPQIEVFRTSSQSLRVEWLSGCVYNQISWATNEPMPPNDSLKLSKL